MMESRLRSLPKAELHVHLEGSMRPGLLLDLARRRRVSLPADEVSGIERWFEFRDFEHFVEIYLACSRCLREPEDFELLMDDFVEQQARQNVVYSEVHFTISTHLTNGVDGGEVGEALAEAIGRGERRGVRVRLIPDIVRNIEPVHADRTLEWALEHRDRTVVALGIAGIEGYSVAPFAEHFEAARGAGLRTTAHAGEQRGPDSIREVLDVCRPERIGHGIRAVDDPNLIRRIVAERIPLEICPTSNVCLGYADSLTSHPFDRLLAAGVPMSVSSDDPPLFGTTLTAEHEALAEAFDYSEARLVAIARAAFEQAFLEPDDKARSLDRFDRAVAESEPEL